VLDFEGIGGKWNLPSKTRALKGADYSTGNANQCGAWDAGESEGKQREKETTGRRFKGTSILILENLNKNNNGGER